MTYTAWKLIGFDGTLRSLPENVTRDPYTEEEARHGGPLDRSVSVRVKGGRTLYESVGNDGGRYVRLLRLGGRARYVEPTAQMEVVE
jgi:hypothetical protein